MTQPATTRFLRDALTDAFNVDHPATTVVLARKLLEIEPEDAIALARLGRMLGLMAHYDEAEHTLNTALKYIPESKRYIIYGYMGRLRRDRGDYEEAAKWYRMAMD